MKNCLLIMPLSFYSFSEYLKQSFISLGYNVILANEEYPYNIIGKIMGKLHIPLSLEITNAVITEKFIKGKSYDLVLIIKGRGMSIPLINKLKEISPKVIGYNFDSFKYHSSPINWYKNLTDYYTFDYRDAEKHSIRIVELFSSISQTPLKKNIKYSISAIVRNHSNRLKYIDRVLKTLEEDKIFIYIFEKDVFTFAYNLVRNPYLFFKYRKYIHFKTLPYIEYVEVLQNSNFTIDYAHPKQSGITIRCFEALSCQTKIITNNPYNIKNPNFNDTNNILFSDEINPNEFVKKYNNIADIIPKKITRSRIDFIRELTS